MILSYTNKKGKTVNLNITKHALYRFKERYNKVYDDKIMDDKTALEKIEPIFKSCCPLTNLNRQLKKRKNRNVHSLYYVNAVFCFVIENSSIVTIELIKDYQGLN